MNLVIDITMCSNKQCERRDKCARAEESGTIPNYAEQSWAEFNPENAKRCKYYYARSKFK